MITDLSIEEFFLRAHSMPVIDVRSPGEFEKGHIPGAVNIPLFSNTERARVGTVYVQNSREEALKLGYNYVTPKLDWYVEESRKVAGTGAVAIHCWRGGMRSRSFAEHLHEQGFQEIYLIIGGYKAFRRYVLEFFEQPFQLRIIGGFTGSGKTCILKILEEMGEQIIDLEGLAHHKGSVFGSIGESAQSSVEQFENDLFARLREFDTKTPIWVEDESHKIGKVCIPLAFFRQIREQNLYFVKIPKSERARHLVTEYAGFGNDLLAEAIENITRRLGGQNVKLALQFLEENKYYEVALIALQFYDNAYKKGVQARDQRKVFELSLPDPDHQSNALSILKFVMKNERN